MAEAPVTAKDRVVDAAARGALGAALLLPYALRVRTFGWVFSRIVAPIAGWRKRVDRNLRRAMPELSASDRARLVKAVPDNVGRALIEIYSGDGFLKRVESAPKVGPGVKALAEAHDAGRPIILVTAHFGNYDAVRGSFAQQGYEIGALYKPMRNRAFNAHYLRAISIIAEPLFTTSSRGVVGLVRHLRNGGVIGLNADVASRRQPVLRFFDRPAHTALSAAKWAVEYDALMIPVFGVRGADGLSFHIQVEDPVPHDAPEVMMQAYNDAVERLVRAHPEQWFWIHNRWKLAPGVDPETGTRA